MMNKDEILKSVICAYNMTVNTYQQGQSVPIVDNCFAFMFTNIGDTTARVNGMVIYPATLPNTLGDSRSIGGHWLNLYKGTMNLSFDPGGLNPNVEIVQLYYAFPYQFK